MFFLCLVMYPRAWWLRAIFRSFNFFKTNFILGEYHPEFPARPELSPAEFLFLWYYKVGKRIWGFPIAGKSLAEASFSNTICGMGKEQCREPSGFSLQQCSTYKTALSSAGLQGASPRAGAETTPFYLIFSWENSPWTSQVNRMKDGALQFVEILTGEVFICKSSLRKRVLAGEGDKLSCSPLLRSSPHSSPQANCKCRT